jgi:hypothetical protein
MTLLEREGVKIKEVFRRKNFDVVDGRAKALALESDCPFHVNNRDKVPETRCSSILKRQLKGLFRL